MPEGHTLHRLANDVWDAFGGRPVQASSPQGRFVEGAALLNGHVLRQTEAHGKHFLADFEGGLRLSPYSPANLSRILGGGLNAREDFSLTNNLAAANPAKLKELQGLFLEEATKYRVLPIDDRVPD